MIFVIPYRARTSFYKFPLVTVSIIVLCLLIYTYQEYNQNKIWQAANDYCEHHADKQFLKVTNDLFGHWNYDVGKWESAEGGYGCANLVMYHYVTWDPERVYYNERRWMRYVEGGGEQLESLQQHWHQFEALYAPHYLTRSLLQGAPDWNVLHMIFSSLAHANWSHVLFNCLFFFIFAATVEMMIGRVVFLFYFFVFSIGIGVMANLVHLGETGVPPSLGLSGVVMGYMALFSYLLPHAQVRYAYWFFWAVGVFSVPAWATGLWYIGWNVFDQFQGPGGYVNFGAHLSGAALGLIISMWRYRKRRYWKVGQVSEDEDFELERHNLVKAESFRARLENAMTLPLIFAIVYYALLLWAYFVVTAFVEYTTLTLILGTAAFSGWFLYLRWRRPIPDTVRYRRAIDHIEHSRYSDAAALLKQLVATGYTRAMITLGEMHERGRGVVKSKVLAAEYYRRAADVGNAEGLYLMGLASQYGDGVPRSLTEAQDWFEKAVARGKPEAARALGNIYEHGRTGDKDTDRERMIYWYRQAAEMFTKRGLKDEADLINSHLQGLTSTG